MADEFVNFFLLISLNFDPVISGLSHHLPCKHGFRSSRLRHFFNIKASLFTAFPIETDCDLFDVFCHGRVVASDLGLNFLSSKVNRLRQLNRDRALHFARYEAKNALFHGRDDCFRKGLVFRNFSRFVRHKKLAGSLVPGLIFAFVRPVFRLNWNKLSPQVIRQHASCFMSAVHPARGQVVRNLNLKRELMSANRDLKPISKVSNRKV